MFLRNQMRGISPQGYAVAHQVLTAGYGFVTLLLVCRLLPVGEAGTWMVFVAALSLSDMLMHGLLQTVVVKNMAPLRRGSLRQRVWMATAAAGGLGVYLLVAILAVLVFLTAGWCGADPGLAGLFAGWYPLLGLPMLLYNVAWWVQTGAGDFRAVLLQRLALCAGSLCFTACWYAACGRVSFEVFAGAWAAGYVCGVVVAWGWLMPALPVPRLFCRGLLTRMLGYGKYTVGTMLGSSLLRNADVFMIAAFCDASAVAAYSVAQKCVELFEIPLRGVAAASLPALCRVRLSGGCARQAALAHVRRLTLAFVPGALLLALYADRIPVLLFGGGGYAAASAVLPVFMLYVLLLPADRLLGVLLEVEQLPQRNALKTAVLAAVNILGNIVALALFRSLTGVAMASIAAVTAAILAGLLLLPGRGFPSFYFKPARS